MTLDQQHHLDATAGNPRPDPAEAPWIGLSCRLEAGPKSAVPAALASFFDRHETLRCDYVRDGEGFVRRLLPAGEVEFEELPLGDHLSAHEAHAAVIEHLATHAQPHVWPRAAFVTVEGEGEEQLTLFAAFDHVGFDLGSMHAAVDELTVLQRGYVRGDGPHPCLRVPLSHLDHAAAEQERLDGITAEDPRLTPWREALQDGSLSALPSASGIGPDDRWGHELVSMPLATKGETADLEALARSWGCSLGTAFVALMLRALAGQEGAAPYDVSVLLAVPGRTAQEVGAVGWFTAVHPLRLEVDPGSDLATLSARVSAERHRVQSATLPTPLVSQLLGVPVTPSLVLAFVDHRSSPGVEAWKINQARGFLGHVPAGAQVHASMTCLPEGAFLEARHPATPECGGWVATLAVTMRRALLAVLDPTPAFSNTPVSR